MNTIQLIIAASGIEAIFEFQLPEVQFCSKSLHARRIDAYIRRKVGSDYF